MRRLIFQSKIYDYTSKEEAEEHIKKMKEMGWHAKKVNIMEILYMKIFTSWFSYSVEFYYVYR